MEVGGESLFLNGHDGTGLLCGSVKMKCVTLLRRLVRAAKVTARGQVVQWKDLDISRCRMIQRHEVNPQVESIDSLGLRQTKVLDNNASPKHRYITINWPQYHSITCIHLKV